ncbi:hypothetical protein ACN6KF_003036 [Labrys sp. La1]|uniref:hypothetical protein n=1 Tax=Labrys sp. La1 TaxID=3404917 RepID=UPI003EBD7C59
MTDPEKLSIAKASIQASTKGGEPLAHLLRNVADGMFGPEPKGVSIEHWDFITQTPDLNANEVRNRMAEARAEIMKRDADVLKALKDDGPNG